MKYKSDNLAIIIPSNNNLINIRSCINSINNQTSKPGKVIVITNQKFILKNTKSTFYTYIKIKNQVHQRTHGLKFLPKKIKLILQLDDKFILDKRAIEHLIRNWNQSKKNVAGIGLLSNMNELKRFYFWNLLTITDSSVPGKVLRSGFNTSFQSMNFSKQVDWLQGGLSSWRLEYIPFIFTRKFPNIKWSVCEDLIFSYYVKKKLNYDLRISRNSRAYLAKKNINRFEKGYFYMGLEHARMLKVFVHLNKDNLSKILYYYSCLSSGFLGAFWFAVRFNKKSYYYLGRLRGIFSNIKDIKVL
tara:strand:+ start:871 stop:1773 length:903 start_codon:yes stop_codon:yes gene_type:complete